MIGYDSKPFISGGSLLVDPQRLNGFFPAVYHEDWLCILDHLRLNEVAVNGHVGQGPYDPFETPERARSEEFGDILASGLLWLVHAARKNIPSPAVLAHKAEIPSDYWHNAMRLDYWKEVLDQRAKLLNDVAFTLELRSECDMTPLRSVRAAQKRRNELAPEEFVEFITAWASNLAKWRDRVSRLAHASSVDNALTNLGLLHTVRVLEGKRAKVRTTLAHRTNGAFPLGAKARDAGLAGFRDELDEGNPGRSRGQERRMKRRQGLRWLPRHSWPFRLGRLVRGRDTGCRPQCPPAVGDQGEHHDGGTAAGQQEPADVTGLDEPGLERAVQVGGQDRAVDRHAQRGADLAAG